MLEDPIVAEIHRTREMLAAEFDFDVAAIFADMRKRQVALGSRLVLQQNPLNPPTLQTSVPDVAELDQSAA